MDEIPYISIKAVVRRIPKFPSLTAEFQAVITFNPIRVTKPTACQNEALDNYSDIWASKSFIFISFYFVFQTNIFFFHFFCVCSFQFSPLGFFLY